MMKNVGLKTLLYFMMVITLLMMGVFSTIMMPIKEGLTIAIVFFILFSYIIKQKMKIDRDIGLWTLIYVLINVCSMLYGHLMGNSYAFNGINVSVIEPIVLFIVVNHIEEEKFDHIEKALKFLSFTILLYNFLYFLVLNHILPGNPDFFPGNYMNSGGLSIGFTKYHSNNIPWLMFLIPMTICRILIHNKNEFSDYMILGLGLVNAFATLRTAFILSIALSPFIVIALAQISKVEINKKKVLMVVSFGLVLIILIVFSGTLNNLLSGAIDKVKLSFSAEENNIDSGGYVRLSQSQDLINTWLERPILGWGASANAKNVIRSDTPGAYEMQYHAMLMQKGLIGFGIYILLIIWLFKENIKYIRKRTEHKEFTLCILVGLLSILIANATNPYLGSFDRLIMLFLPLLTIRMNKASCRSIDSVLGIYQ